MSQKKPTEKKVIKDKDEFPVEFLLWLFFKDSLK